ncbi:MCE family protein [Hoyosella rhizosphaerae]|nr:MCE family protein [Hoyosella rhizosphaerae]MBN4925484.1 MCE family protein [Hoyosella rhizosphaerae]
MGIQEISFDMVEGRATYPLEVELETADLVMVGTEVRMGQRLLGRVSDLNTDIAPDGRRIAVATVSLDSDAELPRNTTMTVELPNTLGNPYIKVRIPDEPNGGIYEAGDRVTEDFTSRGPDLENALASLSVVLSDGGIGSVEIIANEMEAAIGGRGDDIRRTVNSLQRTVDILNTRSADIDRTLVAASSAATRISEEQETFDRTLDAALPLFDLLIEQWDEIADLLGGTATLASELDVIMTASEEDLLTLPTELANLLEALDRTDVRSIIVPLADLLNRADGARSGDYLRLNIDADVPELLRTLLVGGQGAATGGGQ